MNIDFPRGLGLGSREREGSRNDKGRSLDDGLEEGVREVVGDKVSESDTTSPGVVAGDIVWGMFKKLSEFEEGKLPVTWRMNVAIARKQYLAGVVKENRIGSMCAASASYR
jgi:hypothetical protein